MPMRRSSEGTRTLSGAASLPAGHRVYAIGDIHGRADLLDDMIAGIRADAEGFSGESCHAVFVGDYVDRGLASSTVIDTLCGGPLPGMNQVFLRGNHDDMMLRFLDDPAVGIDWLEFGGMATLYSYGVQVPPTARSEAELRAAAETLRARMPDEHLAFLQGLALSFELGDYLFVHAGIDPDRPLDDQREQDLLWIRDTFLESRARLDKLVVHGHTPTDEPVVRRNRIGIDTGAFASGTLSCLVLERDDQRFIQAKSR